MNATMPTTPLKDAIAGNLKSNHPPPNPSTHPQWFNPPAELRQALSLIVNHGRQSKEQQAEETFLKMLL